MRFSRLILGSLICSVLWTGLGAEPTSGEWDAEPYERPTFQADAWVVDLARSREVEERGNRPLTKQAQPYTSYTVVQVPVNRANQGVLSDKSIFLLGGHGRTYMEESFDWQTQRQPIHGMVEDYNNQDQASIFAEIAFRAGATIVPIRPLHHQPLERVVSLDSPSVKLFGAWNGVRDSRTYRPEAEAAQAAWCRVSRRETAVARFETFLPEAGMYPVYVWAPSGPDRARASYRVFHLGGVDEVVVNHRRVGHGWIYLGRYSFGRGWGAAVEVSNRAVDPSDADLGRIVVADTVRFGNGRGDAVRPGGISNHTREDEASIYWISNSVGRSADRRLHTLGLDRSLTIGAPPRYSAYTNRETDGRFSDRVYLSFHSNASGGRGALGLWARDPAQRPDHQELLAELIGRTVNVGFLQESLPGLPPWSRRTRHQLNHITFGELRRDFIQNEMSATILETAFFDQPDDARWLTDPRALTLFGQASLAALIEWFQAQERPGQPVLLPPPAPEQVSAQVDGNGEIQVRFVHGRTGSVRGGQATAFWAELSRDGLSFGVPQALGLQNATTVSVPVSWPTTAPVFLRIRGVNASGSSLPSPVVAAVRKGARKPILLVDASLTMDGTLNAEQSEVFSRGPETRQTVQRVRPALLMESHRTIRLAQALADLGIPFSMVNPSDLAGGKVELEYSAVVYDSGAALPDFQPMPTAVAGALQRYVNRGGRVIGMGNWLAQSLAQDGADGAALLPRVFAAQTLAGPVEFSRGVTEVGGSGRRFDFAALDGRLGSSVPADGLVPSNAGRLVLRWSGRGTGGAAVAGPGGVLSSVSPASLEDRTQAREMLAVLLAAAGVRP